MRGLMKMVENFLSAHSVVLSVKGVFLLIDMLNKSILNLSLNVNIVMPNIIEKIA